MNILIVEDNLRNIEELNKVVVPNFPVGAIRIVQSKASAIAALDVEAFDLVILDRKVPTTDGALDEDVAHGAAVYGHVRAISPGTPIRFWTAFPDEDHFTGILGDAQREDVWGAGQWPMINAIAKSRFDQLNAAIEQVRAGLQDLQGIELRQQPGNEAQLTTLQGRVLKIFARRMRGDAVQIAALSGGLSGAMSIRATVFVGGRRLFLTVGKIAKIEELSAEEARYQQFNRLPPGTAPAMVCQVKAGAASLGGTFYQLAAGYDRSLFETLTGTPTDSRAIVERLREAMKPWEDAAAERRSTIGEIRRRLVSDDVFRLAQEAMLDLDLGRFEGELVTWREQWCHGDFHGENVLVTNDGRPILIDYEEADDLPAALDPITLELSAVFHPSGPRGALGWPTAEQAARWDDINAYVRNCPYPDFIRACRGWAFDVAPGNRSLYAVAYSYTLRQFKYEDTDKDVANALIRAIVAAYART